MKHLIHIPTLRYLFAITILKSAEVPQDTTASINPSALFPSPDPIRSADADVFQSLLVLTQSMQYPNVYTHFLIESLNSDNCSVKALCTEFLPSDPTFRCDAEGRLTAIEFDERFKFQQLDLSMVPNSVQSLRFEDMRLHSISTWTDLERKSLTYLSFGRMWGGFNVDLSAFTNPQCNLPLKHLTYSKSYVFGGISKGRMNDVLVDKIRNWIHKSSLESLEIVAKHEKHYNFHRDGKVWVFKSSPLPSLRRMIRSAFPAIPTQGGGDTVSTDSAAFPPSIIHCTEQYEAPRVITMDLRGVAMNHLDLKMIPNSVTSLRLGKNNLRSISDWTDLEGKSLEQLSFFAGEGWRNHNKALRLNLNAFTNPGSSIPLKCLEVYSGHILHFFGGDIGRENPEISIWIRQSTLEELRVIVTGPNVLIFHKNGDFELRKAPIRSLDHGKVQTKFESTDTQFETSTTSMQGTDEAAAPSPIHEVWNWNFEEAMHRMLGLVAEYPFIAVDSEFPGKIFEDGTGYDLMRRNVNALKVIQLGFTLFNEKGQSPTPHSTFQFNFRYDISSDAFNQGSLQFLQENSGIDFARLSRDGIAHFDFAEKMRRSNLVRNNSLRWLCFHGVYDFGYLVKMLFSRDLPRTESQFIEFLHLCFPIVLDLKVMRLNVDEVSHCGGLQHLADELGVVRVGQAHQAGSDAHLTGNVFFALKGRYLKKVLEAGSHGVDGMSLYELGKYPCSDRECGW